MTLLNAVDAVEIGYERVFDHKREVSDRLRQNKDKILAQPQPRITLGTRFPNLLQERRVFSHIHLHIREVLRGGKVNTPEFADPSQRLHRAGE